MEPIPNGAPEDARPPSAEVQVRVQDQVRLRALTRAEHILLGFPLAFFPPLILAAALAHTIPAAASWAIAVLGTAALWLLLSLRPSVSLTPDALIVESMLGRRRIPWSTIRSIEFDDVTDSDTDAVVHRVIAVRYRRDPDQPLPDMPTRLSEFREWNKAHFRTVRLPLPFPPPQPDDARRDKPTSRLARRRDRMRAILLRELAAHGHDLNPASDT